MWFADEHKHTHTHSHTPLVGAVVTARAVFPDAARPPPPPPEANRLALPPRRSGAEAVLVSPAPAGLADSICWSVGALVGEGEGAVVAAGVGGGMALRL